MFNFLNLRLQQIIGKQGTIRRNNCDHCWRSVPVKPVFDRSIFENPNTSYSTLATNLWADFFSLFELTDIMRQKDDKSLQRCLTV